MSDPISVTVNESSVIAGTTITVSQANIAANGSVSVTVANSAIASGAGKTIVSSGGIADLTSAQQLEVGQGTIVVTTDGYRYIYSGAGSKTNAASYVILADMTPDWATLTGKPATFPPSGHASSHGAAGSDPITVAALQISGGSLPANAVLDFSDGTNDSEVGGWGFGTELTADTTVYATVTPSQVQVHNADGASTLTPGTLAMPNGTSVAVGTFDNGLGGSSGISMNCAVGYELNWQAGHLRCTPDGGANTAAIIVDSPFEFPVPPGNTPGADNVQIDYVGITFTDGSMQTTAAIPLPATPADGDVLMWNATAAAWVAASSGIAATAVLVADLGLSFPTDDNLSLVIENIAAALDGKAPSVHSHAASDITSGSLDIARIPTGTSGTTVCIGNDSRLADARTPTAHTHPITDITDLGAVLTAKANVASPTFTGTVSGITKGMVGLGNVPNTDATQRANHTGTQTLSTISDAGTAASRNVPATGDATSTQVVIGSDTRLTNSRTPTAHKSSHATGGSDALTAADIGAAATSHTHAASDITSGTVATARLGSGTAGAYTWLAGDQAWKTFAFIPGYSGFADADDWASRVTTNGGSVSTSTMTAVYQFCLAIAAAGIRDRFYRLSLLCGTGLNAALVPLYRGPTRTGTQYGNTTDTNNGPFVSGDYADTGSTGGLKGNGSTKYLATGLTHIDIGDSLAHVMGSFTQTDSDFFGGIVGTSGGATYSYRNSLSIENTGSGRKTRVSRMGSGIQPATLLTAGQKVITVGCRTGSTEPATYYDQMVVENTTQATSFSLADPGYGAFVLAYNEAGSAIRPTFAYVRAYSMGLAMNVAQVAALVSALRQFEDAMGRR